MKRQCERFVEDTGGRCHRPALGRSPFCWSHFPHRETWGAGFLIAVLFFVLGIWVDRRAAKKVERFQATLAHTQPPVPFPRVAPVQTSGDVLAILGSNWFSLQPNSLIQVTPEYSLAMSPSGSVLLFGEIRNKEGAVVAAMQEWVLLVRPGLNYDSNWDATALEVVDPDQHPVLQVMVESGGRVLII